MSNSPFTFRRIFRNINSSSRLIIPITDFIRIDSNGIKRLVGKSLLTLTKSSLIDEIVFVLTLLGLVCRGRNFLWRRRIVTLACTIAFGTALRTRDVEVEIFLVCGSAAFGEGCNCCFGVVEVEITLDKKRNVRVSTCMLLVLIGGGQEGRYKYLHASENLFCSCQLANRS